MRSNRSGSAQSAGVLVTHRARLCCTFIALVAVAVAVSGCGFRVGAGSDITPQALPAVGMTEGAPASLGATAAATAMLGLQASDIAAENASTGNTDYFVAAQKAGAAAFARTLSVGGLAQLYALPATGDVSLGSIRPTGYYIVLVDQGDTLVSTFLMWRDASARVWRYSPDPLTFSPANYLGAVDSLKKAAPDGARGARLVWVASQLSWWLVGAPGGDQVLPIETMGATSVAGHRLEMRLYPPSVVREKATWQ